MASGDVMTAQDDVNNNKVLRDVLADHRQELVSSLDTSTLFLTYLAKHHIIEPADILKYENYKPKEKRNSELLDKVIDRESMVDNCYSKFIDALKRSEQDHLAAMLTNVDKELEIVNQYQELLEKNLEEINDYLHKESRRTELHYSARTPDSSPPTSPRDNNRKQGLRDLLQKVHHTTKSTIVHLSRCREVINKLHSDCGIVAKKNSDLLSKLRECDMLIKHTAPVQAVKDFEQNQQDKLEMGSMVSARSGPSPWTRSRENEAAALLDSIRHNVGAIVDEHLERRREEEALIQVIQNMTNDIKARRSVLDRYAEAPPRDLNKDKYTKPLQEVDALPTRTRTKMKIPVFSLAEELQVYVHQESQMTHRQALDKLQKPSGATHRNFDQIEHDLMHLDKEVRRGDYVAAAALLKQISEATKSEREDCLRMTEDMARLVRVRRLRLQEISAGSRPKKRTVARRKPTRSLDTNFLRKLTEVDREIRTYLDLEIEVMAKHKEELIKKRLEYEKEMRSRTTEIKNLDKKLRELEKEKEKYRKLYVQEKAIKETKLLTKPIIPKRVPPEDGEGETEVTVLQKSPSRGSAVFTKQYNYVRRHSDAIATHPRTSSYKMRYLPGRTPKSGQNFSPDRGHRGRSIRQMAPPRGQHSRSAVVPVRPRLTPQAKHLTKLKAAVKDRQATSKPAGTSRFSYTVRNI